mmetsp:Transcript_11236/g.29192  ORF Transcript_11236/g.29192 Transcript_11236/m.29192 type:complete len:235 (-) Transcript_11236:121-825(-)
MRPAESLRRAAMSSLEATSNSSSTLGAVLRASDRAGDADEWQRMAASRSSSDRVLRRQQSRARSIATEAESGTSSRHLCITGQERGAGRLRTDLALGDAGTLKAGEDDAGTFSTRMTSTLAAGVSLPEAVEAAVVEVEAMACMGVSGFARAMRLLFSRSSSSLSRFRFWISLTSACSSLKSWVHLSICFESVPKRTPAPGLHAMVFVDAWRGWRGPVMGAGTAKTACLWEAASF